MSRFGVEVSRPGLRMYLCNMQYLTVSPRISSHLLASPRISPYLPRICPYLPVSARICPYPPGSRISWYLPVSPGISRYPAISRHIPPYLPYPAIYSAPAQPCTSSCWVSYTPDGECAAPTTHLLRAALLENLPHHNLRKTLVSDLTVSRSISLYLSISLYIPLYPTISRHIPPYPRRILVKRTGQTRRWARRHIQPVF